MPLDDKDLEQVTSLINNTVNGVVATLKKQGEHARQKDLDAFKSDFAKTLDEKLAALKPAEPTGDDPPGKGGKNGKGDDGRQIATLTKMVEELKNKVSETETRANAERAKNRDFALRQNVARELETHGVTGARLEGAFALLQVQGKIRYAADDSDDISFIDETGTEVDYRQGLSGWVKSDQAKIYLPPSGAGGAGTRPGPGRQPQVKGPVTPAERNAKIGEALSAWAENSR